MQAQKKKQKKVKNKTSKRSKEKIKSKIKVSKGVGYYWLKIKGLFKRNKWGRLKW